MDFAIALNKESVETLEILLVWGRHRCDWLKKTPLEEGGRHRFLEKWEMVVFSEMERILSLDEKMRDQKDSM